jgi:hydroxyethylthiazole kinase-like uncharacterized protein yjeF
MLNQLRIVSSAEMRNLDQIADQEYGIDATLLMENAGRAATQILLEKYPQAGRSTEILVIAGKGNNAGDAFVIARNLICLERRVRIFHLQKGESYKGSAAKNFKILEKMKAKLTLLENNADLQAFFQSSPGPFSLVDGIIGTGLRADLEGIYFDVVQTLNALKCSEVIALDIPSGVSGDTGAIRGTSILAQLTISFGFPKLGHFLAPGATRRGELINVDISLPPRFRREGDQFLLMKSSMSALIQERDRYGHKNAFGHTLLIGGSPGRLGAITMAARACHKMGTGLVTVAHWKETFEALSQRIPDETMAVPLHWEGPEYEAYRESLPNYSSIVVGPGLGLRPEGKTLLKDLLTTYSGPVVLDADALNLVAEHQLHDYLVNRKSPTILTPHVGEMARLLDQPKEVILQDPVAALRQAVALTHSIVLLKGAATLICSPEDRVYLNHYPNDGMATAGSGDVLAGMIGSLLGQRMDPFNSTLLGVFLHSLAGDYAAQTFGHRSMTAPNIIENIGNAFKEIKNASTQPALESRIKLL